MRKSDKIFCERHNQRLYIAGYLLMVLGGNLCANGICAACMMIVPLGLNTAAFFCGLSDLWDSQHHIPSGRAGGRFAVHADAGSAFHFLGKDVCVQRSYLHNDSHFWNMDRAQQGGRRHAGGGTLVRRGRDMFQPAIQGRDKRRIGKPWSGLRGGRPLRCFCLFSERSGHTERNARYDGPNPCGRIFRFFFTIQEALRFCSKRETFWATGCMRRILLL